MVGAIIVMVIAGLIVFGVWECIKNAGSGTTSIQDISEHPERYIGKEVTVEGYFQIIFYHTSSTPATGAIYKVNPNTSAGPNYFLMLIFPDNYNVETLVNWAVYKVTGIVQENFTSVFLIVSQVEST